MIVGGNPNTYEVEIVDLSGNNRHCTNMKNGRKNVNAYHSSALLIHTFFTGLSDRYGVGTYINGQAMVCNSCEEESPTGQCFVYDEAVMQ